MRLWVIFKNHGSILVSVPPVSDPSRTVWMWVIGKNSQEILLESSGKANEECVIERAADWQCSLKSLTGVWKTSQNYLN